MGRARYEEIVSDRRFEVVTESEMVIRGAKGADVDWRYYQGQPGGPGPNLTVKVSPLESYVRVFITGVTPNRVYYLAPDTKRFLIGVPGGDGGHGGDGASGGGFLMDNIWVTTPPTDGSDGGDGGAGGRITVKSQGVKIDDFLRFDVSGGKGGPGGRGGGEDGVDGRSGPEGRVVVNGAE